jgi:hypothetical protein
VFDLNQIIKPSKSIYSFAPLITIPRRLKRKRYEIRWPVAAALGIAFVTAFSFFVVFVLSGIKPQLFGTQDYDHRQGSGGMLFPDWLAIAVLLFLLVWAVSAWIQQDKS